MKEDGLEQASQHHAEDKITQHRVAKDRKKTIKIIAAAVFAALLLCVSLVAYFVPPLKFLSGYRFPHAEEGALRLHFVDVGQGDCTIVEFPEGNVLIIDAGGGSFSQNNRLARYLKGLNPKSVSMLLTHSDLDHYGGFLSLLKLYDPETFYLPFFSSDAQQYQTLQEKLSQKDCTVKTIKRYDTIESSSGAYLVCLSPYSQGEEDQNDASAVLFLKYGGVKAVFASDISSAREERLCAEYELDETLFDNGDCTVRLSDVDILKAAHHGSASASCERWLSLLRPKTAVISCGRGNSYSHPAQSCITRLTEAGAQIYRTDECGDIMITINQENYSVMTDWR